MGNWLHTPKHAGLTDWDITSAWSTLGVLIVGAWAGPNNGGVVAALIMSGVLPAHLHSTSILSATGLTPLEAVLSAAASQGAVLLLLPSTQCSAGMTWALACAGISGAAVNAASSILGDFKTGAHQARGPLAALLHAAAGSQRSRPGLQAGQCLAVCCKHRATASGVLWRRLLHAGESEGHAGHAPEEEGRPVNLASTVIGLVMAPVIFYYLVSLPCSSVVLLHDESAGGQQLCLNPSCAERLPCKAAHCMPSAAFSTRPHSTWSGKP